MAEIFASAPKCRGSDYAWWYVSCARTMMHDDAYQARALALAS